MRSLTKETVIAFLIIIPALIGSGRAQFQDSPVLMSGILNELKQRRPNLSRIISAIRKSGVDFQVTPAVEAQLRAAGATPDLIKAAGDNLRLSNGVRASFLTITANVRDAQFEIAGKASILGVVSEYPLPPGTYRVTARKVGYMPDSQTVEVRGSASRSTVNFNLKPMSVSQLLLEAEASYKLRDYAIVETNCREILSREPTNAKASMLLAQSYYFRESFDQSLDPLLNAIRAGESAIFDGQRLRGGAWSGRSLSPGRIVLRASSIAFQSGEKDDFEVPYAKIRELKTGAREEVSMKVKIPKSGGKGEEEKDFNFYPVKNQYTQTNLSILGCNCAKDSIFILNVIRNIRLNPR